jgi:hypothetical protein
MSAINPPTIATDSNQGEVTLAVMPENSQTDTQQLITL